MSEQQLINQPVLPATSETTEDKIFVMPAEYRGGAPGKLHQPDVRPVPSKAPLSTPQPPRLPVKPLLPRRSKQQKWPIKLIVVGIIIIAVFVAAAILLTGSLKQSTTTTVQTPISPVIEPEPEPEPQPMETTPVVEPEPEPESEPTNPFGNGLIPGSDTDTDGLTDVEELLYATDPHLPDTDADGFLDGNEVYHRYNPNVPAPAVLRDSDVVMLFAEADYGYAIYYPTAWSVRALDASAGQAIFTAPSGEIVQILKAEKSAEQSVVDWFLTQDFQAAATDLLSFTTKEGLSGAMSPDRLTAYLADKQTVYVVSYSPGTKTRVDYLQTFQMMLNSLILTANDSSGD